jgi:cytochrome c553
MRTTARSWLTALALLGAVPCLAQPANQLQVAGWAATCANCHGTQGRPAAGSALPALAGMPRDAMLEQLRAFRAGTRPSTIMGQLAKGYSESQLEQIAAYFAAQPR